MQDPEKGYIKVNALFCGFFVVFPTRLMFIFPLQDDCVIFEVKVNADAPHGVSWDRCDKISVSQMNQLVLHFQQEAHRLCWPQESGRHLLHELPPSGLFLIIKAKFHSGFALRCCTSQTCCARPSTRCPRSLMTARSLSLLLFKGSSMSCRFVLLLSSLHFEIFQVSCASLPPELAVP